MKGYQKSKFPELVNVLADPVRPPYFPEFNQSVPTVGQTVTLCFDNRGTYLGWLVPEGKAETNSARYFIYGQLGYKSKKTIECVRRKNNRLWVFRTKFGPNHIGHWYEVTITDKMLIDEENKNEFSHYIASQIRKNKSSHDLAGHGWASKANSNVKGYGHLKGMYSQIKLEKAALLERHQKEIDDLEARYREQAAALTENLNAISSLKFVMAPKISQVTIAS